MPVQRDYILRLLEQAAAALRRLRELLGGGTQPAVIVEEARAAQAALFGDTWALLERVEVATATALIRDSRQLSLWADLLRVEAEANRAQGNEQRSDYLEARAAGIAAAAVRAKASSE